MRMTSSWARAVLVRAGPWFLAASLAACISASGAPIDSIYYNGKVVTVDDRFTIAQAMAVWNGRIVAVGSNRGVRGLATRGTKEIDLGGRTVLPGFYDSHVHLSVGEPPEVHDWTRLETFSERAAALRDHGADLVVCGLAELRDRR